MQFVMCAVTIAAALCGSLGAKEPRIVETDLWQLLPAPASLGDWRWVEGPVEYFPSTLWEYLDGGAERYVSYGFRSLTHVRYQLGDDPTACVTVDVFDMGGILGAFGIYRSGLTPEVERRDWGAEGHRSGNVAVAWKGKVYVHAEADDERPDLIDMLERSIAHVCDAAPGRKSLPAYLDDLPPEGLVPQSERYVPADLLGHAFLPGGFLATYNIEGREVEVFESNFLGVNEAHEALEKLRDHYALSGAIVAEVRSIGTDGFRFSDRTLGCGIIVRVEGIVVGVFGEASYADQAKILNSFADLHTLHPIAK